MPDRRDLELLLTSGVPIVVVETPDEERFLKLLERIADASPAERYRPLFRWSITDGLQRLDLALEAQRHNAEPTDVLRHIRSVTKPGLYALLDFHPFLDDPVNVRLLKDIAIDQARGGTVVMLISHAIDVPAELEEFSARFRMSLPGETSRRRIVEELVVEYRAEHPGRDVHVDPKALDLLVKNLSGLSHADTARLARTAIYDDGAVTAHDLPAVMQAKYRLLNAGGVLGYEYDTASFSEIAGLNNVKVWLRQRRLAFAAEPPPELDPPKGILLLGVQGCGKSLAAKAAAGVFGVPLLRLDFGTLYNKYHGETERNLREALETAEVMSPCVLWIDELEKGVAVGDADSGTSRRVLGALLTWMAERESQVLVVATANDVRALPPELVRKGRFDEIFFVDLPTPSQRADILSIHLTKRGLDRHAFDLHALAAASEGFSGAELEQAVVSALYAARAADQTPESRHVLAEIERTRPLAVVMAEKVGALREWARERTVAAD